MIFPNFSGAGFGLVALFLEYWFSTVADFFTTSGVLKSISPNWFFRLEITLSVGFAPIPLLLLLVGPSTACSPTPLGVALNPLSPFPGITFPLRGSLFLLTFSSLGSVDTFCILSSTKALFFSSTTFLFISSWVVVELCSKDFAEINSNFASSIADFVLSLTPAEFIAVCNLLIELTSSDLLICLSTVGCVGCVVFSSVSFLSVLSTFELISTFFSLVTLLVLPSTLFTLTLELDCWLSLANAFDPKNANPAAINTEAVPILNFFIP